MIRLVRQPKNSEMCGQACVAMIANISLTESVRLFGTKRATYDRHIVKVLRELGFDCPDRFKRFRRFSIAPKLCLVEFVNKKEKISHVVVWYNKKFYDPYSKANLKCLSRNGYYIYSYLPIKRC